MQAGARQVEVTINGLGERAGNASLEEVVMALRTRPTQFRTTVRGAGTGRGAAHGVQTEHITAASRLVSYLTGFAVQPNKAVVGGNAFAHESGIHQDGVIKNPLTYEIMTPQSIGLPASRSRSASCRAGRASRPSSTELGYELEGEALDTIYRQAIELADEKKEVTDDDLVALVEQRVAEVPQAVRLEGWNVTSSHGGKATGMVSLVVGDEEHAKAAIGNGPVDALFEAVDAALQPVFGWHPGARGVRDQGGLGRRGRPGPRAGPVPPLQRRRARRARRVRARVEHEHHRGLDRGLPRRGQQAPRRRRAPASPAFVAARTTELP